MPRLANPNKDHALALGHSIKLYERIEKEGEKATKQLDALRDKLEELKSGENGKSKSSKKEASSSSGKKKPGRPKKVVDDDDDDVPKKKKKKKHSRDEDDD